MSALGQKQTYALHNAMSASPPIATAKADIGNPSCLLYPSKRTCAVQSEMSAKGQKRTLTFLFDHLVGAVEQRTRDGETEFLRGLKIDHKLEFSRRLHWKRAQLFAMKDAIDVFGRLGPLIDLIVTVAQQSAVLDVIF